MATPPPPPPLVCSERHRINRMAGGQPYYTIYVPQSTYIYRVHSSVWRLSQLLTPHPPLNPASVSSLRTKGRGVHTRRAVRGWGGQYFGRHQTLDLPLTCSIIPLRYVHTVAEYSNGRGLLFCCRPIWVRPIPRPKTISWYNDNAPVPSFSLCIEGHVWMSVCICQQWEGGGDLIDTKKPSVVLFQIIFPWYILSGAARQDF